MTLYASMQESTVERDAIMSADGIVFDEEKRHQCEVRWVINTFYPDNKAAAEYFKTVEKHRGKAMADHLRNDCRIAWKVRNGK